MKLPTLLLPLFLSSICLADIPTTRPAAPKLLVLPFTPIDPRDSHTGLGSAFQQALVTEFSRNPTVLPVTPPAAGAPNSYDMTSALAAGRSASAQLVVLGSYQIMGPDVRVLGQILDVDSDRPIGGLRITGNLTDIFDIEDALASQARRQLTPSSSVAPQPAHEDPQDSFSSTANEPLRMPAHYSVFGPMAADRLPDGRALLDGAPDVDLGYGYGDYDDNYAYEGYGPVYGAFPYYAGCYRFGGCYPFGFRFVRPFCFSRFGSGGRGSPWRFGGAAFSGRGHAGSFRTGSAHHR